MALKNYILLSFLFIILYACEQDACTQFLDNTAHMRFYSSITEEDSTINNFSVSRLNVDTTIFAENKDTSGMKLPLDLTSDLCEFLFKVTYIEDTISSDVFDTISLFYSREPQYVSSGCGFKMSYKIEDITFTQNNFDSITIVVTDSLINIDNENQFKIYF